MYARGLLDTSWPSPQWDRRPPFRSGLEAHSWCHLASPGKIRVQIVTGWSRWSGTSQAVRPGQQAGWPPPQNASTPSMRSRLRASGQVKRSPESNRVFVPSAGFTVRLITAHLAARRLRYHQLLSRCGRCSGSLPDRRVEILVLHHQKLHLPLSAGSFDHIFGHRDKARYGSSGGRKPLTSGCWSCRFDADLGQGLPRAHQSSRNGLMMASIFFMVTPYQFCLPNSGCNGVNAILTKVASRNTGLRPPDGALYSLRSTSRSPLRTTASPKPLPPCRLLNSPRHPFYITFEDRIEMS